MDRGSSQAVGSDVGLQSPAEPAAPIGGTSRRYARLAVLIALTDGLAILIAMLVAYLVRFGPHATRLKFLIAIVLAPPAWIAVLAAFRLYGTHRFASAEEFRRIVYAVTTGMVLVVVGSFWFKADLSRKWVGTSWALSLVLVLAERRLWHHRIWRLQKRGTLTFRTLIVGTNDEADHLARVMGAAPVGFEAIGAVSTGNGHAIRGVLPVVGDVSRIRELIRETGAECVFVASSALRPEDMRTVTKAARLEGIEVRVSANVPEMLSSRISAQPLGGLMAFSMWPVRLTGSQALAKRTFDVVVGAALFVVSLPFWAAIALAVKATSKGPVLFRQTRVGRRGAWFTVLKFRTMVAGADSLRRGLESRNEAGSPLFKIRDDSRITRVGRFLRRWSLDELPQLVNVLRGDMSLVGPRPPLPHEVAAYEEWHRDRLEVRPGITGLWQVSGRSDLVFDDYVRLDLFYIENWSLAYDLFLLAKTVPAVISGRGAF